MEPIECRMSIPNEAAEQSRADNRAVRLASLGSLRRSTGYEAARKINGLRV